MICRAGTIVACITAFAGVTALSASLAFTQNTTREKPKAQPPAAPKAEAPAEMIDAQKACMDAATPGPMHQFLAEAIGTWKGKTTMWMTPDAPPQQSECVSVISPIFEGGQFTKCTVDGEMPGMGMFHGFGTYGFDNVSQKFQSTWCDNMGTGMMWGTGERSSDGKVINWTMSYNCLILKKPVTMREVETRAGKDSYTLEMFGPDPSTGKEFKVMQIVWTRMPSATATGSATTTTGSH